MNMQLLGQLPYKKPDFIVYDLRTNVNAAVNVVYHEQRRKSYAIAIADDLML